MRGALSPEGYCVNHDPNRAEEIHRARSKGGKNPEPEKIEKSEWAADPIKLVEFLARCLNEAREDRKYVAIAQMAKVQLAAFRAAAEGESVVLSDSEIAKMGIKETQEWIARIQDAGTDGN